MAGLTGGMANTAHKPSNESSILGIDLRAWRHAEKEFGRELAAAAAAVARLDERITVHPKRDALIARLALREVCDLSWADGSDIPIERLALYRASGTGGGEAAARNLLRADWAIRRLIHPDTSLDDRDALITFLGLTLNTNADDTLMDLIDRALGTFFVGELDSWIEILNSGSELHPFTCAAIGYQFWRLLELASSIDLLEPAIIASKLAAHDNQALPFVPFATQNRRALHNLSIHPEQRLHAWIIRIQSACEAARRDLIALEDWQGRAGQFKLLQNERKNTQPFG